MKKLKSAAALLLALLMVLALVPAALAAEETDDNAKTVSLAGTFYGITVPAGYEDIGVTEEDIESGMVSTYAAADSALLFDIYAFTAEGTAEEFMRSLCEAENGGDFGLRTVNGLELACFTEATTYAGIDYCDKVYGFEAAGEFILIDFYAENAEDLEPVEDIMDTLNVQDLNQIELGDSPFGLVVPAAFVPAELDGEDIANGMTGYYFSDASELDFDVYKIANPEGLTLEAFAAKELENDKQAAMNVTKAVTLFEVNGIQAAAYGVDQEYEGLTYDTVVLLLADETEEDNYSFVKVVFWLSTEATKLEAESIIATLDYYDYLAEVSEEPQTMLLGSTNFVLTLPRSYVSGDVYEEDFVENSLVGTYYSPYSALSFDLYQCDKATEGFDSLDAFMMDDCKAYDGTKLTLNAPLENGIVLDAYESVETFADVTLNCMNFAFEDDKYFVELCFYYEKENAEAYAELNEIIGSLSTVENAEITAGSFKAVMPAVFTAADIDADTENMKYAEYSSANTAFRFYTYELTNTEKHFALKEYAEAEAASYAEYVDSVSEIAYGTTNGIEYASFYYTVDDSGAAVLTVILENDSTSYVEFDFVIRDYADYMLAAEITASITKA